MGNEEEKLTATKTGGALTCRRGIIKLLGFGFLMPLASCGRGEVKMKNYIVLDVEMFSYVDRVIHDIMFDGADLGVMNKFGGTGTITGVRIPFGIQTISWVLGGPEGTPRNGENVKNKNTLVITPEQITPGTGCLGLHLYPDDTVEVTFAEFNPNRTGRGEKIWANRK